VEEDADAADADEGMACAEGGTPCDNGNPCTDDRCDPARGCGWVPNSATCDDGDRWSTGDTCRDGACRPSSILPSWHRDEDRDTYGDPAASVCAAEAAPGPVADGTDCCDMDGDVHPDQAAWFPAPNDCGGEPPFDYDCDGVEEPRWTDTGGGCRLSDGLCRKTIRWEGSAPPACGTTGRWRSECILVACLVGASDSRVQECR